MNSPYSTLPKFSDLMSDQAFYKELINSECPLNDDRGGFDETFHLNELEEVFSDHILMGKRLQRSLYRGSLEDLNDDTDHPPIALTDLALKFFSKAVPNYGLDQLDMDYVSSVSGSTRLSPCAMILALIYLERLQIKNSDYLESVSPSGLFVVTMLVASKFLFENEDDIVTNQIWSEALNMDIKELNLLEQKFLAAIDWQLYVDSSEFFQYLSGVEKMIAVKQSSVRGWLSYSDICSILQDAVIKKSIICCIERIIKVCTVSALSYAVTILSIYTAGCALHCKYESRSLEENVQVKINEQRSFPDISNVEFGHNLKISVDETSGIKSIFNNLNRHDDNSDFNQMLQGKNLETLSLKDERYSVATFSGNSLFSVVEDKSKNNSNIYLSYFQNLISNHLIYKLEWWPTGSKNICIPVSVK